MTKLKIHIARSSYSIAVSIKLDRSHHAPLKIQAIAYNERDLGWQPVFRSPRINTADPDITAILEMMQTAAMYHRRLVRFCEYMNARQKNIDPATVEILPHITTVVKTYLEWNTKNGEILALAAIFSVYDLDYQFRHHHNIAELIFKRIILEHLVQ